jgi:hypothetical protein
MDTGLPILGTPSTLVCGDGIRGEAHLGCLFAIFAGCFPRLATIFIWLARPTLFSNAFGGW